MRYNRQKSVVESTRWLALAACVGLSACSGPGQQRGVSGQAVELDGDIVAIESLIGSWVGQFVDADSGDSGSVRFSLQSGAEHGVGEMIMHPNGERHGLAVVAMREIRIDRRGQVRIRLLSLADIQCRCDTRIELTGRLLGDEMSGSYVRHRRDMSIQTGRWSMTRQ